MGMTSTHTTKSVWQRALILLAVCLLPLLARASGQEVRQLVDQFDKATAQQQVALANRLMARLHSEGLLDSPVRYTSRTPADTIKANVWYWAAEYLSDQGHYKPSLALDLKALPLAEKGHDEELTLGICSRLSVLYTRLGNYSEAIGYAQRVLNADLKTGDPSLVSSDLSNIAGIYLASKQAAKALPYALRAIDNSTAARDTARMAIQHGMAAEIYHNMGHNATALQHAQRAYELDTQRGATGKAAIRLCQMGTVLMSLGRDAEARTALTRALPMLQQQGNRQSLAIACNQLGRLALKHGDPSGAAAYFSRALPFLQEQGDIYNESTTQEGLYLALRNTRPAEAMRHLRRFCDLKDSLYNHEIQEKLSEYDARYHNEELRRANAEQRSRQRWLLTIGIAIIVVLVTAVALLVQARRLRRRKLLLEREQAEMKDRFFTNVTHEFRTPLSVIQMASQCIFDDGPDHIDDIHHHAQVIQRQGNSLLRLVNQLLDIAKLRSGVTSEPRWVNASLNALVHVAADSMSVMASRRQVAIACQLPAQELRVDLVLDYMQKILVNLMSNAVKFSPAGATVTVSAGLAGDHVWLSVVDQGCGMTPEQQQKAFEPFYQAPGDSQHAGTGIGLSLVRLCAQAMGGEVAVVSAPGQGSTFTLTMPVSCGHPVPQAAAHAQPLEEPALEEPEMPADSGFTPSLPTAVVAEDSPDVANYVGHQLQGLLNVVFAADGNEALARAREVMPDVIVTDVMMPGIDGFELCREVRNDLLLSHIPVIMVTARNSDDDRVRGLEAGADAYLVKPFNPRELQVRVRKLMEQRKLLQQKYAQAVESGQEAQTVENCADREFLERAAQVAQRLIEQGQLTVAAFASAMCIGQRQLQRRIGALTGDTPAAYLMRLRLRKAKELLRTQPGLPVAAVAQQCGFDEPSSFSRTFKHHTGLTPTQFARS